MSYQNARWGEATLGMLSVPRFPFLTTIPITVSILFYHSYSIRITEIEDQDNIAVTWYYSNQRLLINRHAFLINLTRRTNTVGLDNNALQLLSRLQNKEKGEQVQQPKSEEEQEEAEGERRTLSNSDSNQDLPAQQELEHHRL